MLPDSTCDSCPRCCQPHPGCWHQGQVPETQTEHHLALTCLGVMPPDEYHSGVNNSVYTNVLVQNRSDPRTRPTSTMQEASQEHWAAALSPYLLP